MCAGAARAGLCKAGIRTRLSQGLHANVRPRKGGAEQQNDLYQGVMPQLACTHKWRPLIYVGLAGSLSPLLFLSLFLHHSFFLPLFLASLFAFFFSLSFSLSFFSLLFV
jgi:hypothetical protein